MLHRAANIAGWNADMRYLVMHHAGCRSVSTPQSGGRGVTRPSMTCPSNSQRELELVMAVAERTWKMNGCPGGDGAFPSPRCGTTWDAVACDLNEAIRRKITEIWAEARERMPGLLASDALDGFVVRMTKEDAAELTFSDPPRTLAEVSDPAQLNRIIEGLKGWVGRKFFLRGITPRSFTIPANVKRQEARRTA